MIETYMAKASLTTSKVFSIKLINSVNNLKSLSDFLGSIIVLTVARQTVTHRLEATQQLLIRSD